MTAGALLFYHFGLVDYSKCRCIVSSRDIRNTTCWDKHVEKNVLIRLIFTTFWTSVIFVRSHFCSQKEFSMNFSQYFSIFCLKLGLCVRCFCSAQLFGSL